MTKTHAPGQDMDRYLNRPQPTLFLNAAHKRNIAITCRRCDHRAVFDPHQLWWRYHRKGWSDRMEDIARHLKCRPCSAKSMGAVRTIIWATTTDTPTVILPWPDEREWKRAVSRYRS